MEEEEEERERIRETGTGIKRYIDRQTERESNSVYRNKCI